MKTIAMYLPQFHRIPENDLWWGDGYTEWTAVKKATPLFDGHYQPHIPLNENYYDLMDKSVMVWQANLMHEYQIDGFCFYHYYFKDGRKVLEKPAEHLLKWKDVDIPFCFSWANESWVRTWSRISGNTWNNSLETNKSNDNGVLLKQAYGEKKEWIKHIEYLSPFFADNRYIKKDNKPVFIIYKPNEISCLFEMIQCWNEYLRERGYDGVYLIGVNTNLSLFDAFILQQPGHTCFPNGEKRETYLDACESIINDGITSKKKTQLCGFVSYDDTPRRGKDGSVITGSTPQLFYELMKNLYYISDQEEKEFVFVNAWNEWGEGMHLEPDSKFGYGYLEAIRDAQNDYKHLSKEEINRINTKKPEDTAVDNSFWNNKYRSHYHLLHKWLLLKENEVSLGKYCVDYHINTIAIYGMGILGKHLLFEMQQNGIRVDYCIDRSIDHFQGLEIYDVDKKLPQVDLIIVTPIDEYESIIKSLIVYENQRVTSLSEIIDYCLL